MMGMTDEEYQACLSSLGLLEGEQIRLQYVCKKITLNNFGSPVAIHKGLLVFTDDNMTFMQQEGTPSFFRPDRRKGNDYGQAIRVPIESVSGVVMAGGFLQISVGVNGITEQHIFGGFQSETLDRNWGHQVRNEVERTLKEVREERRRLAQQALSQGTVPSMVFCKFCGVKNKADQPKCSSCGAPLS
jgi:hypothetical protein